MAKNKRPNHRPTFVAHMSGSAEETPTILGRHRDKDPLDSASTRKVRDRAQYISTPEAAEYLGLSDSYLNKARHFGTGPKYVRFGRAIRYDLNALEAWARARSVAGYAADGE